MSPIVCKFGVFTGVSSLIVWSILQLAFSPKPISGTPIPHSSDKNHSTPESTNDGSGTENWNSIKYRFEAVALSASTSGSGDHTMAIVIPIAVGILLMVVVFFLYLVTEDTSDEAYDYESLESPEDEEDPPGASVEPSTSATTTTVAAGQIQYQGDISFS